VAIVAVVQVAIVNVVDVVTVGDGYVAAALAVDVVVTFVDGVLCVAGAVAAFVPVAVVIVVQVAVVNVVDVVAVGNGDVAAAFTVDVVVAFVNVVHGDLQKVVGLLSCRHLIENLIKTQL
jgi:putative membrane protein